MFRNLIVNDTGAGLFDAYRPSLCADPAQRCMFLIKDSYKETFENSANAA